MDQRSQKGFFEQKLPSRLILWSFPLLTLPLAAGLTLTSDHRFLFVYIWLFGLTHFVLTLSVYLQSENLKHFAESGRNILLFFGIPLIILMGFYVVGVFQLRVRYPAFAVIFSAAIRLLDFNHLNRQTFGVYQMFKARAGVRGSAGAKRLEQGYLATLTALLFTTYLAGGVYPLFRGNAAAIIDAAHGKAGPVLLPGLTLQAASVALTGLLVVLGVIIVSLAIQAWRKAGRPSGLREALSYLGFQTAGTLLAVFSMPMYFAALAIHYVEYHVLMFPRCFHSRLHDQSPVDRCFGRLRRRPAFFYGVVGFAALVVLLFTNSSGMGDSSTGYLAVVSIFDGLFVFHYFVETLIWRFSDPFFRRTLTSLYFVPQLRSN